MTTPRPTGTSADPPRGCGPAWERPGARPARMSAPRPTGTSVDPPRGCGPAWERPGARPARMSAPRPTGTSADPPRGCGPAWERPGARPASRGLTRDVSSRRPARRPHARQVGGARACVQLAEQRIVARRRLLAHDVAARIVEIAEMDRAGRARRLAGG